MKEGDNGKGYIEFEPVLLDMMNIDIGDKITIDISDFKKEMGREEQLKLFFLKKSRSEEIEKMVYYFEKKIMEMKRVNVVSNYKTCIFTYRIRKKLFVKMIIQKNLIKFYLKLGSYSKVIFGNKNSISYTLKGKKCWEIKPILYYNWGDLNTEMYVYTSEDLTEPLNYILKAYEFNS